MHIHTDILDRLTILEELNILIDILLEHGLTKVSYFLGWPWALEYYPGNTWDEEEIALTGIREKIFEIESLNIGKIGDNDFYISSNDIEIKFCHEGDIHLSWIESDELAQVILTKWRDKGFEIYTVSKT